MPYCRWSAYGGYQRAIWYQLDRRRGFNPDKPPKHEGSEVVRVQALAALLGGCTSALLTNPLDVVKTRLQVSLLNFSPPRIARACSLPFLHLLSVPSKFLLPKTSPCKI